MDSFKAIKDTIKVLTDQIEVLKKEREKELSKFKGKDKDIYTAYESMVSFKKGTTQEESLRNLKTYSNDYVTCLKYANSIKSLPKDNESIISEAQKHGQVRDKTYLLKVLKSLQWESE